MVSWSIKIDFLIDRPSLFYFGMKPTYIFLCLALHVTSYLVSCFEFIHQLTNIDLNSGLVCHHFFLCFYIFGVFLSIPILLSRCMNFNVNTAIISMRRNYQGNTRNDTCIVYLLMSCFPPFPAKDVTWSVKRIVSSNTKYMLQTQHIHSSNDT